MFDTIRIFKNENLDVFEYYSNCNGMMNISAHSLQLTDPDQKNLYKL